MGPWKARLVTYLDTWFIEPEGGETVCLVNRTNTVTTQNPDGSWTSRKVPVENADAIAHLIEAAPELLEGCRKALSCASIDSSVRELIRAAIAKAQGKERA